MMTDLRLTFDCGTILLDGELGKNLELDYPAVKYDNRTGCYRAPARSYREIVLQLTSESRNVVDNARNYSKLDLNFKKKIEPREHQTQAIKSWQDNGYQGVIELPTGAGKTILAVIAMGYVGRPTLVVVPTIDLMEQWCAVLSEFFDVPIGMLGGGKKEIRDITVSTYDSAVLNIETIGKDFGFLICDECHHLPAPQYQIIGEASIAPFRMGLSATVDRVDGKESLIYRLLGQKIFVGQIEDLGPNVLAPYDVVSIEVPMKAGDLARYQEARDIYLKFVRANKINFSQPWGWQDFIRKAARLPGGRDALKAHRLQKHIAQASEAKLEHVWEILQKHRSDKTIIFTEDNKLAYKIGRLFLLPVLTHQTKPKERKYFLDSFRQGTLSVLVTSKVLNEGVDVPEASVAIIVSGGSSVREHVQRLGRILRHREGKRAVFYEVISRDTSETAANKRRKQHYAYQRSN